MVKVEVILRSSRSGLGEVKVVVGSQTRAQPDV